jgi:hypothetical protein
VNQFSGRTQKEHETRVRINQTWKLRIQKKSPNHNVGLNRMVTRKKEFLAEGRTPIVGLTRTTMARSSCWKKIHPTLGKSIMSALYTEFQSNSFSL